MCPTCRFIQISYAVELGEQKSNRVQRSLQHWGSGDYPTSSDQKVYDYPKLRSTAHIPMSKLRVQSDVVKSLNTVIRVHLSDLNRKKALHTVDVDKQQAKQSDHLPTTDPKMRLTLQ